MFAAVTITGLIFLSIANSFATEESTRNKLSYERGKVAVQLSGGGGGGGGCKSEH